MGLEERGMDTHTRQNEGGKKKLKQNPVNLFIYEHSRRSDPCCGRVSVQRAAQARRIARIRCCLSFHSSFVQSSEDTMLPADADADLRQFTAKPHGVVDTGGQRGRHARGRRVEISLRSEGDRWQYQCRLAWLSPTACSTEGIRQGVGRDSIARPA